jgi:AcrR family transcriptional regulator
VAEPLTRRDRVRAATVREIKDSARRTLVRSGVDGLSLRAIARDMGITAPALYRYFPGREELLTALVADLYNELADQLEQTRDGLPEQDTGGRLLAVSRKFRDWALAHPPEFSLLFGSPIEGFSRPHDGSGPAEGPAEEAGQRFGTVFATLIAQLYLAHPFPAPADEEIEPRLRTQLAAWAATFPVPLPLGVMQVFLSCWIRLYGSVCMEAFGHLKFAVTDCAPMFEAELREMGDLLGIADAYRSPAESASGLLSERPDS